MRPPSLTTVLALLSFLAACGPQSLALNDSSPGAAEDGDSVAAASAAEDALTAPNGAQVKLVAEADAYTRSGAYANTNFGSATSARADLDDGATEERAYVRFSVGAVGALRSAKLRLYVTNGSTDSVNIGSLGALSWIESTLTHRNRPASAGTALSSVTSTTAGQWLDVDVTPAVSSGVRVTFALVGRSADGFGFATRESGNNAPQLVLTLDAPPDVVVTSPAPNAQVSGSLTLVADAADDRGVARVEFLIDGASRGVATLSNGHYSANFDSRTLSDGSHAVSARATDSAGQVKNAPAVNFTVKNVVPPPVGCQPLAGAKELFHTGYPHAFCSASGSAVILTGFNVRNVGLYASPSSAAAMAMIKAKGFNTVRFVMRWSVFEPSPGAWAADPEAKLAASVANAKAAGLYIIIDPIHLSGGGAETPAWAGGKDSVEKVSLHAANYIKHIAQKYADEPAVVAIDLVNEPWMAGRDDARLMSMYETLITAARSVDQDKILIIEPMYGDSLFAAASFNALTRKENLVFSYHDYYSGTKTAAGAKACAGDANGDGYHDANSYACGANTYDETTAHYALSLSDKEVHLKAQLDMLAAGPRLPLYVGEFNILEGAPGDLQWRKDMVGLLKKYALSRTAWEFYSQGPLSATTNNNGAPGAFKSWVNDLL